MNITKATFKSFIRKNEGRLLNKVSSSFDGMTDGTVFHKGDFHPVEKTDQWPEHSLGIRGVWLVGRGRDYFSAYSKDGVEGIAYSNSCGSGVIAVRTEEVAK